MDTKALQLLSKFSLPPNALHYCGHDTAQQAFKSCITQKNCDQVPQEVKKFIVLWPYLKTLGQALNKDPFSYEIIEAYWFGNHLLEQIQPNHYDLLLQNLQNQGVPDFLLQEIKSKRPDPFIPVHLFNILHVGVGKASGAVPFNLQSINNCMIRWGVIKTMDQHQATLDLVSIVTEKPPYKLATSQTTLPIDPNLTPHLNLKDIVAVHWNQIVHILTPMEQTQLSYWTNALIQTF